MRLWHKDLLSALPRLQLISQYRECCCIAKSIAEKKTPNHVLVNRVMDYPLNHFVVYTAMVMAEMKRRGYKVNSDRFWHWMHKIDWCNADDGLENGLFADWHNDVYLRESLYNLEEKAICGAIPADEWHTIYDKFKDFTPLWKGE